MDSFSYLEPVCCSMSSSKCCFLTWIQISQEAGQVVRYSHLLKNFPHFVWKHQRCWLAKAVLRKKNGAGGINFPDLRLYILQSYRYQDSMVLAQKQKYMFFLEFSCFFCDPANGDNFISGTSAFSKSSLNIWRFSIHILLNHCMENFEHYSASVWDGCNCVIVRTFFGIGLSLVFEWKLIFSCPVATNEFSKFAGKLSAALSQHHLLGFEIA